MSVTETPIRQTEDERVGRWRLEQLVVAGYDETDALVLAYSNVDLHVATDLLRYGCPPSTALRILL